MQNQITQLFQKLIDTAEFLESKKQIWKQRLAQEGPSENLLAELEKAIDEKAKAQAKALEAELDSIQTEAENAITEFTQKAEKVKARIRKKQALSEQSEDANLLATIRNQLKNL